MLNDIIREKCEESLLFFTRYIFKENTGSKFVVKPFHVKLAQTLEAVQRGEIKRLIINIPPRYGKTEIAVKNYMAWCIAKNPIAKFMHLSYADALALDNSAQTRDIIKSDAYQALWPIKIKSDADSQKKWYTTNGGGVYASASGGPLTGFGAGAGGAIIIDDPLKPDDATSDVKRIFINNRYNTTIRSRVNGPEVPIIVIMQRLHENDMTGFLLEGGSRDEWHHLCIPVLDEENEPIWPEKHSFDELEIIRQADRYTFSGQYMQQPSPQEGGEWRKNWFNIIKKSELPSNIKWEMFIDGAYTNNTKNDPTGIQVAGKHNGNLYILSSIDKYLEMPELKQFISSFVNTLDVQIELIMVEPKASGKSLVQLLRRETKLNIAELNTDFVGYSKIERARASSPFIEGGRVFLIEGQWNEAFLHQVSVFPNAKHDEHVDLTSYAIERNLIKSFFVV